MGTTCIVGAHDVIIDEVGHTMKIGDKVYTTKDVISIDGTTGNIYEGEIPLVEPQLTGYFGRFMELADKYRRLEVRVNADTPLTPPMVATLVQLVSAYAVPNICSLMLIVYSLCVK